MTTGESSGLGTFGYKNQNYMSASAFRTMAEEISRQRQTTAQLSRSASIGIDMTPSTLNPIREVISPPPPPAFPDSHFDLRVKDVLCMAPCHLFQPLE
jgi:hypothetical protein